LWYLKDNTEFRIFFKKGHKNTKIVVYTDTGFAGDINDRKSTY